MDKLTMDRLHDQGLMPDWAYYQQSGLPWYVALQQQKDQFYREYNASRAEKMKQAEIEARATELAERYIQEQAPQIQEQLEKMIDRVIGNLNK